MLRKTLVAAVALLGVSGMAHALRVLEAVERPVELALQDLNLPDDATGVIRFRTCPTCTINTHGLTAETTFTLNRRPLALPEFLAAVEEIRSSPSVIQRALAGVFLDVNTERVTRIIVVAPGAAQP